MDRRETQLLRDMQSVGTRKSADASFRRVYDAYYPRVQAFFRKRVIDEEECQDLTQETFLHVLQGEATIDSQAAFEGWLFEIALNLYRNAVRYRQAKKRLAHEDSLDELTEQVVSDLAGVALFGHSNPETPLELYLEREKLALLSQVIRKLPDQMRRCAILRYHQGLKYREIAELMKISIETVKAHLYQARKTLKAEFASRFPDIDSSNLKGDPP